MTTKVEPVFVVSRKNTIPNGALVNLRSNDLGPLPETLFLFHKGKMMEIKKAAVNHLLSDGADIRIPVVEAPQ
jgi:hypothetical protein